MKVSSVCARQNNFGMKFAAGWMKENNK
jgi:hypothetical protein